MRPIICCIGDQSAAFDGSVAFIAQPMESPWFRDASKEYGPIGGGPPAFADLDGDGFPELVCDGRIYKNERGKRFTDVTKDCGVSGSGGP